VNLSIKQVITDTEFGVVAHRRKSGLWAR